MALRAGKKRISSHGAVLQKLECAAPMVLMIFVLKEERSLARLETGHE
jgi:hypothetical protein